MSVDKSSDAQVCVHEPVFTKGTVNVSATNVEEAKGRQMLIKNR